MTWPNDFVFHKNKQMIALSELPKSVVQLLPHVTTNAPWKAPNPIHIQTKPHFACKEKAGHYFMGGLTALMQAVRLLQNDPNAHVTYVNDGQLKKSTQSAHQGHVHPTEWTTPELGTWQLVKILLRGIHLLPQISPQDVMKYTYVHFPLSKIRIKLFASNFCYRIVHTLLSKNGVTTDDRWQCEAVRKSLAFHKALSDEMQRSDQEGYFAFSWRLIWSSDKNGIERKKILWNELGIETQVLTQDELRKHTLLKDDIPLYGLKVLGDGKFFANTDQKILAHLIKKYPDRFQVRKANVSHVYIDKETKQPFAVSEDGAKICFQVDSFFGSTGHNQVFMENSKKPLWDEVPVTGVSTLWVCSVKKDVLIKRLGDLDLLHQVRQFVGSANLTNLHMTVWDACIEDDMVHIIIRATQGANFNSEIANPNDLYNMAENIKRFFIGSWKLICAGSCVRKTTTSNVPELKENFVYGLSGIGFSFSAAPKEMLNRKPLTSQLF